MTLIERLGVHATKVEDEGMYVTRFVIDKAIARIVELEAAVKTYADIAGVCCYETLNRTVCEGCRCERRTDAPTGATAICT